MIPSTAAVDRDHKDVDLMRGEIRCLTLAVTIRRTRQIVVGPAPAGR